MGGKRRLGEERGSVGGRQRRRRAACRQCRWCSRSGGQVVETGKPSDEEKARRRSGPDPHEGKRVEVAEAEEVEAVAKVRENACGLWWSEKAEKLREEVERRAEGEAMVGPEEGVDAAGWVD